jgi:ankyrin repeat protein
MHNEFFEAVKTGDADRAASMLDADPSLLSARDETGVSAYAVARYNRKDDVAALLLERGFELDIFGAAMAGREQRLVELLALDHGLINSYSADGWTPLHLAAFFGNIACARTLVDRGADVNARSRSAMQNMPLHAATATRSREIVELLASHGADVNARQHGGWTALHAAALNGDLETTRVLIAHGADIKARADNQQNALDLALTRGHQNVVDLLDQLGASAE